VPWHRSEVFNCTIATSVGLLIGKRHRRDSEFANYGRPRTGYNFDFHSSAGVAASGSLKLNTRSGSSPAYSVSRPH